MKAKEYLQQVSKLDKMISNKLIEVAQWKAIATGTTASSEGERVKSSSSQQKMENAVCKYVTIQEEIDEYIDKLIDTKKDVISTIEQLPVAEYDLLHQVYIQGKTLDDVADANDKTYSWATTIHGRALKHVQDILDGNDKLQKICVE